MSASHQEALATGTQAARVSEQIVGVGAWAQGHVTQQARIIQAVLVNVPAADQVADDEPSASEIAISGSSEPWSPYIVVTPTELLDGARVTTAPIAGSGEAALEAPADSGWSATTTLAGTKSQWDDTATVAGSNSQ